MRICFELFVTLSDTQGIKRKKSKMFLVYKKSLFFSLVITHGAQRGQVQCSEGAEGEGPWV